MAACNCPFVRRIAVGRERTVRGSPTRRTIDRARNLAALRILAGVLQDGPLGGQT